MFKFLINLIDILAPSHSGSGARGATTGTAVARAKRGITSWHFFLIVGSRPRILVALDSLAKSRPGN
jgi:hypothetical protein